MGVSVGHYQRAVTCQGSPGLLPPYDESCQGMLAKIPVGSGTQTFGRRSLANVVQLPLSSRGKLEIPPLYDINWDNGKVEDRQFTLSLSLSIKQAAIERLA